MITLITLITIALSITSETTGYNAFHNYTTCLRGGKQVWHVLFYSTLDTFFYSKLPLKNHSLSCIVKIRLGV